MSELNVYHHELRPGEYAEFYLKYEADKIIAEKDKAIAKLIEIDSENRSAHGEDNAREEPRNIEPAAAGF